MKKVRSMLIVVLAAAMLSVSCLAFAACGGADGTYTLSVGKPAFDMTENSQTTAKEVQDWYGLNAMTGMVAGNVYGQFTVDDAYTVTLDIEGEGYTLRKEIHYQAIYEGSYVFDLTFTGKISETETENTYVLEKPDSATGSVLWGADSDQPAQLMKNAGYGQFKDKTVSASDEDADTLMKWFSTAYPITGECAAMNVVLDKENGTFEIA